MGDTLTQDERRTGLITFDDYFARMSTKPQSARSAVYAMPVTPPVGPSPQAGSEAGEDARASASASGETPAGKPLGPPPSPPLDGAGDPSAPPEPVSPAPAAAEPIAAEPAAAEPAAPEPPEDQPAASSPGMIDRPARIRRARPPQPEPEADAASGDERDVQRALRRGWRRTCPACGGGPLYDGYLTVRAHCPACSERLDLHRADDLPTWITIIVVGHLIAPAMLTVWDVWNPPIWVHWTLWPPLALLLSLLLLPRFKGMVVGLQWAKRMAGFGEPHDP